MGRKAVLEKRQQRLMAKRDKLSQKCEASKDVNEVRQLTEELDEVNADLEEVRDELEALAAEEGLEERSEVPAGAKLVNGQIKAAMGQSTGMKQERSNTDPYDTMEYREAFMKYAQTGTPIPVELYQRDGSPANTTTLGATIPTTVLNEFIGEMRKVYGNLYAKVRKLNIQGGVKIPKGNLQATFKWISESTTSPREDGGKIDEFVEFSYNMAEIRVSQTLLSSIVTIDLFEREIVKVMIKAYLRAMDMGIIKGTGVGQMTGILNDPSVLATGNVVELSASDINNWTAWRKKFFAKLPLGYREGEFIFPVSTVESYLLTMADSNNNPIFKQASGIEVNSMDKVAPNGKFFGREVSLVEPDIITDFDVAENGDVIGVFWQPDEYAINTNMQFGMRRYFDEERNEWVNKMLTVVDGKVLDARGFWLIKKKAN